MALSPDLEVFHPPTCSSDLKLALSVNNWWVPSGFVLGTVLNETVLGFALLELPVQLGSQTGPQTVSAQSGWDWNGEIQAEWLRLGWGRHRGLFQISLHILNSSEPSFPFLLSTHPSSLLETCLSCSPSKQGLFFSSSTLIFNRP